MSAAADLPQHCHCHPHAGKCLHSFTSVCHILVVLVFAIIIARRCVRRSCWLDRHGLSQSLAILLVYLATLAAIIVSLCSRAAARGQPTGGLHRK